MLTQAKVLVAKMKGNRQIDFVNDWKLLTIFIGGNDLCSFCLDPEKYSPKNYANNIRQALDFLKSNVPRLFVNLMTAPDVLGYAAFNVYKSCDQLHRYDYDYYDCPCTRVGTIRA